MNCLIISKKFENVTRSLQRTGVTGAEVRLVFEAIIEDYPGMGQYLEMDANMVNNPDFKNGLFIILTKDFAGLTKKENSDEDSDNMTNKDEGYYEQLLK